MRVLSWTQEGTKVRPRVMWDQPGEYYLNVLPVRDEGATLQDLVNVLRRIDGSLEDIKQAIEAH